MKNLKGGNGLGGILDDDGFDEDNDLVGVSDAGLYLNCVLIDYAAHHFSN